MVADISWWPTDGCCYFLVAFGWLLIFRAGLWMAAVISSAVGNAPYDASGRRTRCRGPTRRERTTRRTVSYKASGPDTSGMYDASYSVVQGVVQHRHRTTQYDTVRHSTTQYDTVRHGTSHTAIYICRHINTCKWKKKQIGQNGAKWVQMRFHFGQNSPKGETSNIGTSRLQHADNVYN